MDKDGQPVIPSEDFDGNGNFDIEGDVFSNDVVYSSPDLSSSRVNIAFVEPVFNEIGPFNGWDGVLRWNYVQDYIATAFTGVEMEPNTVLQFPTNPRLRLKGRGGR